MTTGSFSPSLEQFNFHKHVMEESSLLIASVDFLEKRIDEKLLEIDVAEANHNYEKLDSLRDEVLGLLAKLDKEVENTEFLMKKFRSMANNETKKMLSRLSQEKQVLIRGVPPHKGRSHQGQNLQAQNS